MCVTRTHTHKRNTRYTHASHAHAYARIALAFSMRRTNFGRGVDMAHRMSVVFAVQLGRRPLAPDTRLTFSIGGLPEMGTTTTRRTRSVPTPTPPPPQEATISQEEARQYRELARNFAGRSN